VQARGSAGGSARARPRRRAVSSVGAQGGTGGEVETAVGRIGGRTSGGLGRSSRRARWRWGGAPSIPAGGAGGAGGGARRRWALCRGEGARPPSVGESQREPEWGARRT
jgi:hypothetical protein